MTVTPKTPITATADVPLVDAVEELTGFEVIAIQKHYGKDLADIGGVLLTMGVVWAYESRKSVKPVLWSTVEAMTLKQLNGYFPDPPADPDEPLGKD